MKEETLEEAAEKATNYYTYPDIKKYHIESFKKGVKWQQENSNTNALDFEIKALKSLIQDMDATIKSKYSEDEVISLLEKSHLEHAFTKSPKIRWWFEQFKKK